MAFTVAVLEYCTLLLAVTVIGSDTYVIYDPIFAVHIQQTNDKQMSVKSFIYMITICILFLTHFELFQFVLFQFL
jgi:hypothetical protein